MSALLNAVDALLTREAEVGYGEKERMLDTWRQVCNYAVNGCYPTISNLFDFIEKLCEQSKRDENMYKSILAACESKEDIVNLRMGDFSVKMKMCD